MEKQVIVRYGVLGEAVMMAGAYGTSDEFLTLIARLMKASGFYRCDFPMCDSEVEYRGEIQDVFITRFAVARQMQNMAQTLGRSVKVCAGHKWVLKSEAEKCSK